MGSGRDHLSLVPTKARRVRARVLRATRMRDGVRARSPEARVHDGEEGWGEGFVAREPHTETITLSLDYGAALSPPGSLWSTRRQQICRVRCFRLNEYSYRIVFSAFGIVLSL